MSYRFRMLLKVSIGLVLALGLGLYAFYGVHREKKREQRDFGSPGPTVLIMRRAFTIPCWITLSQA